MEKDVTEKMSPIVSVMSKTMTASLKIPHFGYKDEVDMGALVRLRKQLKHQENKVSRGFI
jgi:2-oxoisovalerate dehydrogenase E2 component (dihydrolipoyl transacylase)